MDDASTRLTRNLGRRDNSATMEALLRVTGLADKPQDLDFDALASLPDQVPDASMLVPGREGGAVRLAGLLKAVGVQSGARYITLGSTVGDFSASVPLDAIADQSLILYRLGDEPLPVEKGGPVRFLIADAGACEVDDIDACANVKYLGRIDLSDRRGRDVRPGSAKEHEAHHENEPRPGGVE